MNETHNAENDAMAREARTMLPRVGDVWEWEPLKPHARQTVTVTALRWNGEAWFIESEGPGGRFWNEASRWVQATVLVTPAEGRPLDDIVAEQDDLADRFEQALPRVIPPGVDQDADL